MIQPVLRFRAWDRSQGTAGGTRDLTAAGAVGGRTAFSAAVEEASFEVS